MMGHCLDLQEEPQNLEQILSDCKETLKYCVKTGKTPVESSFVTDKSDTNGELGYILSIWTGCFHLLSIHYNQI